MREIKFRGKTLSGKWVYGYAAKFAHDSVPVILEDTENGISPRKIIPDTVGQFTGLHDKNGKEIYEGDIVVLRKRAKNISNIQTIEWCSHISAFVRVIDGMDAHYISEADMELYEVIGNIHDNPELLKSL